MASRARTPEHFPRMKVRGKGRRALREYNAAAKLINDFMAQWPAWSAAAVAAIVEIGNAAVSAAKAIGEALVGLPIGRQSDYVRWPSAGAHLEGQTPSHVWIDEPFVAPFGVNWDTIEQARLQDMSAVDINKALGDCVIIIDEIDEIGPSPFGVAKTRGSGYLVPRSEEKGTTDE